MQKKLVVLVTVSCLFSQILLADDWPQWRGPTRNGISQESGWTDQWPKEGPPIAWKSIVGLGFSSVVVGGEKAVTAGHANDTDTVFCFDALSGKELWKHTYPAELGDKYYEGGTTGTPTIENDRVFWLSRWGDLFCFDAGAGKIVWSRQLQKEEGADSNVGVHGSADSVRRFADPEYRRGRHGRGKENGQDRLGFGKEGRRLLHAAAGAA